MTAVRRPRKVLLVLAVSLIVMGVVAITLLWLFRSPQATARTTVDEVFHGLATGDSDAISAAGIRVPDAAAQAFAAAEAYLSEPTITQLVKHDNSATADVTFQLDGATHTTTVQLTHADGAWSITEGLWGTLTATSTQGTHVAVGDALMTLDEQHPVLPAVYTVVAAPSSFLGGSATATVLPDAGGEAAVTAQLHESGRAFVQEAIEDYARDCAAVTTALAERCGLTVPWAADLATLESVSVDIERMPRVELAEMKPGADTADFSAADGVVIVTVSGKTTAGSDEEFSYRSPQWMLTGTYSFEGDELIVRVR
ncbi:hypothetical protein [Microbacterium sp. YY-01]|uniref:hypothetical protein n=1 Tax=Microbacterium sp. YY-01 TaxID=3421634 RepID=UPI003D173B8C